MAGNHRIEPLLEQLYRSVLHADGLRAFVGGLDDASTVREDAGQCGYTLPPGADPPGSSAASASRPPRPRRDGRDPAFAERLQPHLHNAHAIRQRLSRLEARILTLHGVLDRLRVGVAVLDMHGSCLFANPAIRQLRAECDGLQLAQNRLRACASADQLQLRALIDLAVSGSAALDARWLLRAPDGRPGLLLTVSTLREPAGAADDDTARAMVFIQPVVPRACVGNGTLKELFGFTDAETTLALALFETGDLAKACEHLGKSMATGRVQLRMLMEKTGCHRQSGLFRVLSAALSMPATGAQRPHSPTSFG